MAESPGKQQVVALAQVSNTQNVSIKQESGVVEDSIDESSKKNKSNYSKVVIADLNVDPPESDGDDCASIAPLDSTKSIKEENYVVVDATEREAKRLNKLGKCCSRINKGKCSLECGPDTDADQHCQGAPASREEKVKKMPKNAHAHFILGLMYQRLGQPQKAVPAYEKAAEILLRSEEEIDRPELLSLVQIHHAQCLLLESTIDHCLKESVQSDIRQASVWNTLGLLLIRTGRLQSATSVLSSLLSIAPDHLDSLANLGISYLQSGSLELSMKCFQDLILKDQNHPAALINYASLLLCKYGSIVAGAGASAGEGACMPHVAAAKVAKECLLAAIRSDPRAAHISKLEPNCMSTQYVVALHRIKYAEKSQDPTEQLSWAANEMASILREGNSATIELQIAWAGLAMVHKAQHEIAATFETGHNDLTEVEERALYTLKQAIEEDPDDAVQWHQLGLHNLCTLRFKTSQKYLKAAVARGKECSYAWSNLGISLQLSEDEPSSLEPDPGGQNHSTYPGFL
uniref:Uncharacterized protein n=1 Tax=Nelumbo nucifera TaxID=4432 RepID=A0A822XTB1_NELNU|nr:TPA_asm: hypothetical protein HUJ06_023518 [Nelumbo nucifera]